MVDMYQEKLIEKPRLCRGSKYFAIGLLIFLPIATISMIGLCVEKERNDFGGGGGGINEDSECPEETSSSSEIKESDPPPPYEYPPPYSSLYLVSESVPAMQGVNTVERKIDQLTTSAGVTITLPSCY